jgi:hypothetical protein
MRVKTIIDKNKLMVRTPYEKIFIKKAKQLNGVWRPPYWVFKIDYIEYIKELLFDIYGENGLDKVERKNIKITISQEIERLEKLALGYTIANSVDGSIRIEPKTLITKGIIETVKINQLKLVYDELYQEIEIIIFDVPIKKVREIQKYCYLHNYQLTFLNETENSIFIGRQQLLNRIVALKEELEQTEKYLKEYREMELLPNAEFIDED